MARWGPHTFDSGVPHLPQLQSTSYRSAYDYHPNYSLADLRSVNAHDNNMNNIFPRSPRRPRNAILPSLPPDNGPGKNWIQHNYRQAGQSPRRRPSDEEGSHGSESLSNFIEKYKSQARDPTSYTHRGTHPIEAPLDLSPRAATDRSHELRRHDILAEATAQFRDSRAGDHPTYESPNNPLSRKPSGLRRDDFRIPVTRRSVAENGPLLGYGHGDDSTAPRTQRFGRKHTLALQNQDGKVIRWVENGGNQRYHAVSDVFDEKLHRSDQQADTERYASPEKRHDQTEKQISGTFGATANPVPENIRALDRARQQENILSERLLPAGKRSQARVHDIITQEPLPGTVPDWKRPKLYRNVTSWRGDQNWGQSTYNATFANQNTDAIERAFPMKKVQPKSGLKNVLEIQTNSGTSEPVLYLV